MCRSVDERRASRSQYTRILGSIWGLLLLFVVAGIAGSIDQSEKEQRRCRIRREGNHPLKFLQIRNVDSDNFPYDLEIDVKNISPKAIYFFRVNLVFPDVPGPSGTPVAILGYPIYYGRFEMISLRERAALDDQPLQPDETLVLRLSNWQQQGLRKYQSSAGIQDSAFNNFTIDFQEVSFGDGTGFRAGGLGLVPRSNHTR